MEKIPLSRQSNHLKKTLENGKFEYEDLKQELKNEQEEELSEKEEVPADLMSTEKFMELYNEEAIEKIYEWYAKAMVRRENREPLEYDSFFYHFFMEGSLEKSYMYGDLEDKGFLLGFVSNSVFVPSHFAPKGLKGGYKIFEELGEGKVPTLLFITEDLAKSLSRIKGWVIENFEILSHFRGEDVKKKIAHNNLPKEKLVEIYQDLIGEF